MNHEDSFARFLRTKGIPAAEFESQEVDTALASEVIQSVFLNCGLEEDLWEFLLSMAVRFTQCKQLGSLDEVAVCLSRFADAVKRLETFEATLFRRWLSEDEKADFPFYLKVTGT